MIRSHYIACVGVVVGLGAVAPGALAQASFTDLGSLPGPFPLAEVRGISADGSTVVGMSWFQAFRWRAATGMVGLELVEGGSWINYGTACSADGSVVVGYAIDVSQVPTEPQRAIVWHAAGAATLLLDDGQPPNSDAYGVSGDGSVVVGEWNFRPVLWRGRTERVALSSYGGRSTAVTPDGVTVVGVSTAGGGFWWTEAAGMTFLGSHIVPKAVSAGASTIVGQFRDLQWEQAFLWTPQYGLRLLGDLPGGGIQSDAMAVSGDGHRVVGQGTPSSNGADAFVYEEGRGMRSVRELLVKQHGLGPGLTGWLLFNASGISADGTAIAGTGTGPGSPNNYNRAWLARLPGCPGDYNRDGVVSPADVTAFVTAWFQSLIDGSDWGDFDLDGVVTPADVAGFVKAWWVLVTTGSC